MEEKARRTGIEIVGDVPWGTHFCQFYQTKDDLIDVLVPYFKAGLKNNEFCMWVTSEPLNVEEAKKALRKKVKGLDDYIKKGQIEILDCSQWYTKSGRFDSDKVLEGWVEKEKQALERGFDGLRFTGNTFWLEEKDWKAFTDYEAAVKSAMGKYRMLAVCTYCLEACSASKIIDVVSNHEFAIVKRQSEWKVIESPAHKETMAVLRESEERFRQVAENIREVFWLYELGTNEFVYVSSAYETIMGRARESLYKDPKDWVKAVHPEDRGRIERSFAKERKGEPFEDEYRIVRPDGSVRWINDRGFKVYDEGGMVCRIAGVAEDVTERKQAEEELRESEERYRAIFAQAADSIVLVDPQNGAIVEFNDRAHESLGYTREEFQKLKIADFEVIESAEEVGEHIEKIIREGGDTFETKHRTKGGEIREILVSSRVISIGGKDLVQSIWRDITERKKTGEKLQEAFEETRRRSAETESLLVGARAVLENREFQEAAKSIFDICKNITGATAGYVALLSKDGSENEVLFLDSGGRPCTVDPELPMPIRGLREEAYRTGKAVYHNDFSNSEWVEFMPEGHASLDNVLFSPLMIEGEVAGLLGLANKPDGFTEDDARIVTAFGELASIALYNSRTLASLEDSEERFRSVTKTANDAIVSIDGSGDIILWNNGAEAVFGYSADEIIGKPVTLIMPARFHEAHRKGMERILTTGKSKIVGTTIELAGLRKDGSEFLIELSLASWKTGEEVFFTAIIRDITERKDAEQRQELAGKILERLNEKGNELDIIRDVLELIKESTCFEAVGIRLHEGDDFPYFVANGFGAEFIEAEKYLCARDQNGEIIYDSQGKPHLECMCGNVLSGRTNPALPFFTEGGSFWTNSTTKLLASTSVEERMGYTRNRCNQAGYESVALIPLRSGDQTVGLLQLNDTLPDRFAPEMIGFFEGIGASIGIALARIRAEENVKNLARFPSENPYPILRIAKDGTILYANSAGSELLEDWGCEVGSGAPEHWCQYILRILGSGSSEELEVACRERIFSLITAPVVEAGYVNIYGIDITERKRAEEDLRKYRHHLEELVEERTGELTEANKQLLEEVEGRKRLEKEILNISEREQQRLGEELHDSLGQQLTGVAFMTKVLEQKLIAKSLNEAADVAEIAKLVNQATAQARGLARGLHPVDLDASSLMSSLEELAANMEQLFGVRCTFECDKPIEVDDTEMAVHLYRIAQEAVTNAIKHGRAKNIRIGLAYGRNKSVMTVKSDGLDFAEEFEARGTGMGLQIMDHRADIIGGSLDIGKAPKGGTIVTCEFPGKKRSQ